MNRRSLLMSCGSIGLFGLAGCTENTNTSTNQSVETEFTIEEPSTVQEPQITNITDQTITIRGTLSVPDSCSTLLFQEERVEVSDDGSEISVSITSVDQSDGNEVCTQVVRQIGFRLEITSDPLPDNISLSTSTIQEQTYNLEITTN